MDNTENQLAPATSPNGLKRVFTRPNRSRTTINELENTSSRGSGTEASQEKQRPVTSGGGTGRDDSPSGIAKLISGSRRRRRKQAEAEAELGGFDGTGAATHGQNDEVNTLDSASTTSSLVGTTYRGSKASSKNHLPAETEPESSSPLELHASHGNQAKPKSSSPLIADPDNAQEAADTNHDQEPTPSESLASASEMMSPLSSHAAPVSVGDPAPNLGQEGRSNTSLAGSSTGRKLRDAFKPTTGNKSRSVSPDRESSKSSGSKRGKGIFGSGRRSSLSSKSAEKPPEDIPPVPTLQQRAPKALRVSTGNITSLDARPNTPPTAVPAPVTTVTPPTPTGLRSQSPALPATNIEDVVDVPRTNTLPANVVVSPSGNMISHRRVRSASAAHNPSKLSHSMSASLTPTTEEPKGSGPKTNGANQLGAGFFSSMFSAAQNAASTLSSSLNTQTRSRAPTDASQPEKPADDDQPSEPFPDASSSSNSSERKKELAVETLGMGDLDFSHLGIDPTLGGVITTKDGVVFTKTDPPIRSRRGTASQRDELSARIEDMRAARAVSMAYEKAAETAPQSATEDNQQPTRPSAAYSGLGRDSTGEQTPPNGSIFEGETADSIKRSGSVRSRLAPRRHRGSSTATVGGVASAGIGLGIPGANSSVPRLTGFAVASKKRNRDFHQLFRSVPEDDYLIEDYSCALQREIILAGRIYISEGHICFSSNILGWVTTLVISFDEIVAIEKETTAMVFPNAIAIQTLHARHTFRSLLSRESTYDLMINIWKINHPTLKSSINGTKIVQGNENKIDKADASDFGSDADSDDEEIYDEDEEGDTYHDAADGSVGGTDRSDSAKELGRKSSALQISGSKASLATPMLGADRSTEKLGTTSEEGADFPGPITHPPTEFTDQSGKYERLVKDETIPAPLGRVYSLVFGPASGSFMSKFLVEDQKALELQFEVDKKGLDNENKTRSYTYIKPLNGAIGPRQTKCTSTENLDFLDLEKAVLVTLTTQTPDVPSGNVFSVKTKYLFTWAPNNQTRFYMSCAIEWTGKSWLKGPIEKGANDGQLAFGTDLVRVLKAAVAPKSRNGMRKAGKGKRKRTTTSGLDAAANSQISLETSRRQVSWGVLEPLRPLLSPFVDTFKPLLNGNVAVGIIFLLLFTMWFRTPSQPRVSYPGLSIPERMAAYEELWRKEESELWDWLEERVGLDGLAFPVADTTARSSDREHRQHRLQATRQLESRLRNEKMSELEMHDAIRVTQQRLDVLKDIIDKRKQDRKDTGATEEPLS
ncbi:hypothetical protein AJ80_03641 [Polytolypa hystricis UAMH7299]|uniref:VASt domain-containing protein n=1 Tax=Polytolypa hystricis (strain UAMH7299) TaxID=1447883 RepID=A0A2B7YH75_POLH7|nr:hypothetical protein AJ80_03641 [Polytolypa hystricis UAMH7299]